MVKTVNSEMKIITCFTFCSLHAVFEGIALGLTASESSVWYLFFAIASHKFVISFCVGMQFVSSGKYCHLF